MYLLAGVNVICFVGGILAIDKDVPNSVDEKKVDWLGAFIITAGLVFILFVLGEGEGAPRGWSTGCKFNISELFILMNMTLTDIIALLVVGVFFVGVFIYWQWFLEKAQDRRLANREVESSPPANESDGPRRGRVEELADRWCNKLPPPIMKLSLWARARGRFSAVMAIAFLAWSAFIGWTFWVQVRSL